MFIFEPNKDYRMPPYFGAPDFDPDFEVTVNDVTALSFTITTDGDRLEDYLPRGFELLRPELVIGFVQQREAGFLYGGSYNLLQVAVPARFNGKWDQLEGNFPLVVWENNARPLYGGREEDGQPKIYADLQEIHVLPDGYFTTASYDGNTFLNLQINNPQPADKQTFNQLKAGYANYNLLSLRYIPKVGAPGADLFQPIAYPQSMDANSISTGEGIVKWTKLSKSYQYVDPAKQVPDQVSQYEIIRQLSELPIKSMEPAMLVKGSLIMKPYLSHVLK